MVSGAISMSELLLDCEKELFESFQEVERIALLNQERVLRAFAANKLTEEFFAEHTGYGIDDCGREAMDAIFADVFECEAAAVRMQMVSGTHAIACALFGNLAPGDKLVVLTGKPYDTLNQVIGASAHSHGSLVHLGVKYEELDLAGATAASSARISPSLAVSSILVRS
ncbi:MAG TPA: methionine gamma-lyase family protein, partial [Candidatus Obscuribacter sp.]|nr:methionine gamma-lyase family protein [Candidatus Obscuribacter sp.]